MKKDEVMTAEEYKTRTDTARKLIDKTSFNKMPNYDMRSTDWQYIRNTYNADIFDMIYASYKLGFARGVMKAEAEATKK